MLNPELPETLPKHFEMIQNLKVELIVSFVSRKFELAVDFELITDRERALGDGRSLFKLRIELRSDDDPGKKISAQECIVSLTSVTVRA